MSLSRTRIAVLAAGAILVVVLGVAYRDALRKGPARVTEAPRSEAPAGPGARLPNAAASLAPPSPVALRGGATRDLSSPSGKLLVVHFWATWCAPCEEELPGLVAWWNEAKADPRIELVAVSVDTDWKTVDSFLAKRRAAGLPLALDPQRSAASAFGTEKFPETWFLSPKGEILLRQVGPLDWSAEASRAELRKLVDQVLGPRAGA
jgi:thiol-disulfide isomerase/thioredoxin